MYRSLSIALCCSLLVFTASSIINHAEQLAGHVLSHSTSSSSSSSSTGVQLTAWASFASAYAKFSQAEKKSVDKSSVNTKCALKTPSETSIYCIPVGTTDAPADFMTVNPSQLKSLYDDQEVTEKIVQTQKEFLEGDFDKAKLEEYPEDATNEKRKKVWDGLSLDQKIERILGGNDKRLYEHQVNVGVTELHGRSQVGDLASAKSNTPYIALEPTQWANNQQGGGAVPSTMFNAKPVGPVTDESRHNENDRVIPLAPIISPPSCNKKKQHINREMFADALKAAYVANAGKNLMKVGGPKAGQEYEAGPGFKINVMRVTASKVTDRERWFGNHNGAAFLSSHKDDKTGKMTLYVCYRDTRSLEDVLTDLNMDFSPFIIKGKQYGRVHSGFREIWKNVNFLSDVKSFLKSHPSSRVVFTGHSMGGAIAHLASMEVAVLTDHTPLMYSFASPRVFDKFGKSEFIKRVKHIRFKNGDDIIPEAPVWGRECTFCRFRYYYHAADVSIHMTTGKTFTCINDAKRFSETGRNAINDHHLKMYIPRLVTLAHEHL